MIDYRRLRPHNLRSPEFRHLVLLIYWAFYGLAFLSVERLIPRQVYHPVWCPLDDRIPFCEWFMIPYMFWFVFLVGMHLYLLLEDVPAFRKMMYFIMLTYSATILVYLVYPTCQELRPAVFPRDNFLTRFTANFYDFDTNTNVCPSLHCVGSMAVVYGAWSCPKLRKFRFVFLAVGLLISVSTVFVKQHSIIDVFWGLTFSAAGWFIVEKFTRRQVKWSEKATI